VVIVLRDRQVVFRHAYGWRSLKPSREIMTADTIFDLASLTKPIVTATAVLQLVEQGKIALGDPVSRHRPSFAQSGKEAVTVAQLLAHTSGLPAANPMKHYRGGRADALAQIDGLALRHAGGSKRRYSDLGYIVLGELVSSIAGESLDAYAARHILSPLGMTGAGFKPTAARAPRIAPTEQRQGRWLRGQAHDPRAAALGGTAGHAGLFATGDDVAAFVRMMLRGGELNGRRVLSEGSVRTLTQPLSNTSGHHPLAYVPVAGGYGHTGFTGTSLWLEAQGGTGLVLLSSRLHPDGKGDAARLRSEVRQAWLAALSAKPAAPVQTGIDRLVQDSFAALRGRRVGLVTNHTGRASDGTTTIDLLQAAADVTLVSLFGPEHGIRGKLDRAVPSGRDEATGLPIHSLYGAHRRPTATQLKGIDTLVFDLQDGGARFYTYLTTLGYLLEAAATHKLRIVVLDRPNPIGGVAVEGPLLDTGRESFIGYHRLPVRHGMTVGELARLFNAERGLSADLAVVTMKGWRRRALFDECGLPWVHPSPNLRSLRAALLYPGIALVEATNVSVGRGTDRPFEHLGAPWLDGRALARALSALGLPGLRISPTSFTPDSSKHAGQECSGVAFEITNARKLEPVRLGIAIAAELRKLHPQKWRARGLLTLLGNQRAFDQVTGGAAVPAIVASWQADLAAFKQRRKRYLLY